MTFDWIRFLESRQIPHSLSGANVARGNIGLHCPFCGAQDRSMHLGIHIATGYYNCWRTKQHKGRNPIRLIQALIDCNYETARDIVGGATYIPTDFLSRVQENLASPATADEQLTLEMPPEFKRFTGMPSSKPFSQYLDDRGFDERDTKHFDIRYCTKGPFKGRIIFPVVHHYKLVSWTGRTIYPDQKLRYRALTTDKEKAERDNLKPALGAISHYLLWHDHLAKVYAHTIVLCEGPFDAWKVDVLGKRHGICATCFFTAEPTVQQVGLLHQLLPRFERRCLMLDQAAEATTMRVTRNLASLNVEPIYLPSGIKDPGEIKRERELLSILS
jgi:hypothetical protein